MEGECLLVKVLGKFKLTDIPPALCSVLRVHIEVIFEIDANNVRAADKSSKSGSITITTKKGHPSKESIEYMACEAEGSAAEESAVGVRRTASVLRCSLHVW